jgi:hypothetical protein
MKIKDFAAPTKGDLPEIEDDIWKLATPMSEQVSILTRALKSRVGFGDNMHVEIRELRLSDDTSLNISLQRLKTKPIGVFLLWEELYDYTKLAWGVVDRETIKVKVTWDSSPGTPTNVIILIIGS